MTEIGPLTESEKKIIETLRTLKPYELVQIMADAQGRPDSFLLTRSSKVLLVTGKLPEHTKVRLHESY